MVVGTRLNYKVIAAPYSGEASELISVLSPVWTSADLADAAHRVNVLDKFVGKCVFDSTLGEPVWASGADASDAWVRAGGDVAATAAEIGAIGDAINTVGKYVGKLVYDTATGLLYAADGPAAGDDWTLIDGVGSTQTTPS